MDAWIIFSTFLLGIGAGALSTAAINVRQIRKLTELLSAANESQRQKKVKNRTDASPPRPRSPA